MDQNANDSSDEWDDALTAGETIAPSIHSHTIASKIELSNSAGPDPVFANSAARGHAQVWIGRIGTGLNGWQGTERDFVLRSHARKSKPVIDKAKSVPTYSKDLQRILVR
jgi:hypothetical protein